MHWNALQCSGTGLDMPFYAFLKQDIGATADSFENLVLDPPALPPSCLLSIPSKTNRSRSAAFFGASPCSNHVLNPFHLEHVLVGLLVTLPVHDLVHHCQEFVVTTFLISRSTLLQANAVQPFSMFLP